MKPWGIVLFTLASIQILVVIIRIIVIFIMDAKKKKS